MNYTKHQFAEIFFPGQTLGDLRQSNAALIAILQKLHDHAEQYGAVPWSADKLWADVRNLISKP